VRLAHLTLECLGGEDQTSPTLLRWLDTMARANTLVLPGTPDAALDRRAFERALIASLGATDGATSVGYSMRALKMAASTVRERLSQEHWSVIVRAEEEIFSRCSRHMDRADYAPSAALRVLKSASDHLAAITGAQTDRMTRDDGWRLLSIGRHIERLQFLAISLSRGFTCGAVNHNGGFEALLSLFDSTITFHAQYQQSRDVAALVDLLVLDRDNPRSLAWVVHTLRGRLAKLAGMAAGVLSPLSYRVPDPEAWDLATLCEMTEPDTTPDALMVLLQELGTCAYGVSEEISTIYFTHSGQTKQSVGT
jgi:uncharacterized alpha-E superfamily protein